MPSLLEAGSLVLEQDKELVTGAARQCLLELEGHSVKYKAVFGNEFRQTVVELVAVSERARGAAEETLKELDCGDWHPQGFGLESFAPPA